MSVSVLCVDDDLEMRESIVRVLSSRDYMVESTESGEDALSRMESSHFDIVLQDMHLPGMSGEQVLRRASHGEGPLFIMVTGDKDVRTAVACMRSGAYDYIIKPFDLDDLLLSVERAAAYIRTRDEVALLRQGAGKRFGEMIGASSIMQRVFERIQRAAASAATTVLVTGESGTGKELVARAIHRESERAKASFVAVNCTAVQETLLESEFFGHEKGAFTDAREAKKGLLEAADGGTILLDEIGDMTEKLQAKLLRFLEDRSFRRLGGTQTLHSDIRVVAATNKDLQRAVDDGRFRTDLFYRLNVLPIHVPALRERAEDIPLLASFFLEEFCRQTGASPKRFAPSAMNLLKAYSWPGNVRELRNTIERLVILEDADMLGPQHLPPEIAPAHATDDTPLTRERLAALPYADAKKTFVDKFTRQYVTALLEENEGNVTRSAQQAQMDRANFQRLLRKVGLSAKDFAS